ncbi:interferon-induced very large GTPase 1-like [Chanos chanos]|uniref:Interferon-induced very large GTPase 1-like n=1 Tax=Chanos chanos TaxID=29144 RepID=A0A6J2WYF9_CHACN|nr:interferon-induced very large GTPase 1-like [Chanos chanos]
MAVKMNDGRSAQPTWRASPQGDRPYMCVLRIVLLGKSVLENRRVGNFILGKAAFDVKATTALVEQHSEKVRGHVQGRPITVINTPDLFHPQLSHHQLSVAVKECVSLSAPGPHVFILVLQPDNFTEEDRHHVTAIMNKFGTETMNYTIVLTIGKSPIHARAWDMNKSGPVQAIIRSCSMRHHIFINLYGFDRHQVLQLIEKIDQMLEENGGHYFSYLQRCDFTVALIGSNAAVKYGGENILLGEEELYLDQSDLRQITPRTREVSGRHVSMINMLGLHELPQQSTDTHISHLLTTKIHVFLYVLPLGLLTDEDKMGLDWLQRTFGEKSLDFVMILFTYETEDQCDSVIDDLKKNSVLEQIVQKCGGRYYTCDKRLNHQSEMRTLLEKINSLVSENKGNYTIEMFQKELKKRQQMKLNSQNQKVHLEVRTTSGARREKDNEEDKTSEIEDLMNRLHLKKHLQHKLTTADVMEINRFSLKLKDPQTETELVNIFLQELLTMNYRARYTVVREQIAQMDQTKLSTENEYEEERDEGDFDALIYGETVVNDEKEEKSHIHPMDVQMAVFHCADRFLQQFMVTKLSQCQYALPLLVPNPFRQQIEFPLWTFRQIKKSWKSTDISGKVTSKTEPVYIVEAPMVSFFRFGSLSSSKSQLMNSLINEKHNTFFHRHCPGSSKTRLLMDGVVEIAWYCPSGKDTDHFKDCVALCNLRGDAVTNEKQVEILTKNATVNVTLSTSLDKDTKVKSLVQKLFNSPTPLICLLSEENSPLKRIRTGKYRLGLKDRNHADVSAELRRAIRECLSISPRTFKLEELVKNTQITVDEESGDCKRGKEAALQVMNLLKGEELSTIKQTYLPCQGELWHDWCQKNKELHRLQGTNVEATKSNTQEQMRQVREQQRASGFSELLKLFVGSLQSLLANEKRFFLKWFRILLDDLISDKLSHLRHHSEQAQLEIISSELNAATCGVEHIFREMGQIYEAWASVKNTKTDRNDKNISSLPDLAAELMISGHPMELMDGDAAHVPLIWVTAVLDEVIKRLGEQRVFVLSVLGLQSTGKSTMLNAMFGLQFAVSAGRCTRGAFMQLVRVTEEMKKDLKFDYILVVDTEGLRALELAGRSTQHHDNELATFVVGLGNMTLINIFGENPAEMQDILQIVVQAFLRMKKVRLSPSCVFVHQNVGDITAGDKTMEGRRCLQEKLDQMTKLAAKEEVCDVGYFNDVISFDVQTDVKYFDQLWEGSPPMAPPNPSYSENVQNLKKTILSQASRSNGVTLTHFKTRIQNLWEALLNENFVFSFKNTHEISVYRKLEEEHGKWAWSLRSAMLKVEDKLHTRIKNKNINQVLEEDLAGEMAETFQAVEHSMNQYFEEDFEKDILIQWRKKFEEKTRVLHTELLREAKRKMDDIINQREAHKKLDEKKTLYEGKLLEKSKELALKFKHKANDENELKREFDLVWRTWVSELTKDTPPIQDIDISKDVTQILTDISDWTYMQESKRNENYKTIQSVSDFSDYVTMIKKHKLSVWTNRLNPDDQHSIREFVGKIIDLTNDFAKTKPVAEMGYNSSYIREIVHIVKSHIKERNSKSTKYLLNKEFTVDLSLFVCESVSNIFGELHKVFREANDPFIYLEKRKPEFYSIFQKYCQGATSTAVFGSLICSGLRGPILQSVYNKTATDLAGEIKVNVPAFSGNRSNMEKHILRSLAEEENFDKYMMYIEDPRQHFEHFIKDGVSGYISRDNPKALTMIKGHIKHKQQCIITAAQTATAQVKRKKGDANMWLTSFSDSFSAEVIYSTYHLSGQNCQDITDFDLLEEVVKREINTVIEELNSSFTRLSDLKMNMFRRRPDEILIKHFCQCCWVQCPFCKAVCTNTIEGHTEDHSVPFHRPVGINGNYYANTSDIFIDFCTTAVASNREFHTSPESNEEFLFKKYRDAGPPYSDWSITPDFSDLPYWKWFICRFQADLEKCFNLNFRGKGEIPSEWRNCTKEEAIESLKKYI